MRRGHECLFNNFSAYRKIIAWRNAAARLKGLELAKRNYNTDNSDYAELQVVATKSDAER